MISSKQLLSRQIAREVCCPCNNLRKFELSADDSAFRYQWYAKRWKITSCAEQLIMNRFVAPEANYKHTDVGKLQFH